MKVEKIKILKNSIFIPWYGFGKQRKKSGLEKSGMEMDTAVVKNWKKYTNPETCLKLYSIDKIVEDLKFLKNAFYRYFFLDFLCKGPSVKNFTQNFVFTNSLFFYTFWKPLISCFQICYRWFWLIKYSW